jgi:hypothetical protein
MSVNRFRMFQGRRWRYITYEGFPAEREPVYEHVPEEEYDGHASLGQEQEEELAIQVIWMFPDHSLATQTAFHASLTSI